MNQSLSDIAPHPDWPPLMERSAFSDWCRVDLGIVNAWIDRGILPSVKLGKHRLVNIVALVDQLRASE